MALIVDAHQHYWQISRGDYGWLTPDLEPIYRDFLPDDLAPILRSHNVVATVLVQAAPSLEETCFLLDIAKITDSVAGVVGWVDLAAADAPQRIAELCRMPKLVGLRPMLQDIEDTQWILSSDIVPALKVMKEEGLCLDLLITPRHLEGVIEFLQRWPDLRCVVDHGAKPGITSGDLSVWQAKIQKIALETNAFCKLSGLLTEADPLWTADDIIPVMDHLLASFGPERLMWGSDWPVLNLAGDYTSWFELCHGWMSHLPAPDRRKLWGETAIEFYGVQV